MSTLQENQSLNAEYERNKKEREMKEEIERIKKDNEYLNQVNIELSTEKNRLNNLLKETSQTLSEQTTKAITLKSENERLNNIINEYKEMGLYDNAYMYEYTLYTLQELKGSEIDE